MKRITLFILLSTLYATTSFAQDYWIQSGSWMGDLYNHGFKRVSGLVNNYGEFVVWEKNGQSGTLIDGSYYAYENGGFFTSPTSNFENLIGFNSTFDGYFNINVPLVKAGGFTMWHAGNLNNRSSDFTAKTIHSTSLYANEKIWSKEIMVAQTNPWPDFVFKSDYQLRSLSEVEQFINTNGHLPEIPTEKEVAQHGVSVGEMNAKLLQKIEELTLYIINQNNVNKQQNKEIQQLKIKLNKLSSKK